MPGNPNPVSAIADGDEPLRVLRFLASKANACGVAVSRTADRAELRAADERCQSGREMSLAHATWQRWQTDGWIESLAAATSHATAGDARWTMTAKGRQALRRALSQSGTAQRVSSRVPLPAYQHREAARPGINPNESPIGWLARRRDKNGEPMISPEQLAAAERLRADFWFAGMSPRVTTNWSAAAQGGSAGRGGCGAEMSDNKVAAATRVRHAALAVGPELSPILMDVCCYLHGLEAAERKAGWPLRSAKIVLQLALTRLARHYGILPEESARATVRSAVRHWGAAGYRPHSGPLNQEGSE